MERLNLHELFATVVGPEDAPHPKPAPDMLEEVVRRLGLSRNQVLYVGDMVIDIETARAAQIAVWAVPTGSDEVRRLEEAKPDRLLHAFSELAVFAALTTLTALSHYGSQTRTLTTLVLHAAQCSTLLAGNSVPRLIVIKGADQGKQFELDESTLSIGRDSTSKLRLHDTEISRRHAEIQRTPDGYRIVDVGSVNGTFVNDAQIKESALEPGDDAPFKLVRALLICCL